MDADQFGRDRGDENQEEDRRHDSGGRAGVAVIDVLQPFQERPDDREHDEHEDQRKSRGGEPLLETCRLGVGHDGRENAPGDDIVGRGGRDADGADAGALDPGVGQNTSGTGKAVTAMPSP